MPGFLMHLAEGEMLLKNISDKKIRELFLLGCVLPDVTDDKDLTHLRPEKQKYLITKYPDMSMILNKYGKFFSLPLTCENAIDMGILAHLHLDALYVEDFWPRYFSFEDEAGNPSCDTRRSLYVRLFSKRDENIPLWDFFSEKYFYGEYDILNPIIYNRFKPFIPINVSYDISNIHIKECVPKNKEAVDISLKKYLPASCFDTNNTSFPTQANTKSKVFPPEDFISFLEEAANEFLRLL